MFFAIKVIRMRGGSRLRSARRTPSSKRRSSPHITTVGRVEDAIALVDEVALATVDDADHRHATPRTRGRRCGWCRPSCPTGRWSLRACRTCRRGVRDPENGSRRWPREPRANARRGRARAWRGGDRHRQPSPERPRRRERWRPLHVRRSRGVEMRRRFDEGVLRADRSRLPPRIRITLIAKNIGMGLDKFEIVNIKILRKQYYMQLN